MQETSTFSRAAFTGTDKDKERKWQYIGKNKYMNLIIFTAELGYILFYFIDVPW